jgi:tetratricopeptide (TPR) repeat protein
MGKLRAKIINWGVPDLAAADEHVAMMRWLSARSPLFDSNFAYALLLRARLAADAQQWTAALESADGIVTLHGRARRSRRKIWRWLVAQACLMRAVALRELGRREAETGAAEEAVERYRSLVEADRKRHEPMYALALSFLAESYGLAERHDDAVRVGEQAVVVGRRILARGGDHDLWDTLVSLSAWSHTLYRDEEGARYGQEAVDLLRHQRTDETELTFALALLNLGACLSAEHPEEALPVTDEAIARLEDLMDREPGAHENRLTKARRNRAVTLEQLGLPEERVLGPYPLCARCREVNGGLVATRHRQVHVAAHGRESCVDEGLAKIMPALWAVCETTTSCQDEEELSDGSGPGRAYVAPLMGQTAAAEQVLVDLGFDVENVDGLLTFRLASPEKGGG